MVHKLLAANLRTDLGGAAVGFLLAVTVASAFFTVLLIGIAMLSMGGFETATTNSLGTKAIHLAMICVFFFVAGWIFAAFTAAVPYAIAMLVAYRLQVRHWLFFVVGGAMTAAASCPLFVLIPQLGINIQEPEPSFQIQVLAVLPVFLICGTAAGAVCWLYFTRKSGDSNDRLV